MGQRSTEMRPGRPGQAACLWLCAIALASCTSTRSVDEVLAAPPRVIEQAVVDEPAVEQPAVAQSAVAQSAVAQSEGAQPEVEQPPGAERGGVEPAQGTAAEPGSRPADGGNESSEAPAATSALEPAPPSLTRLASLRLRESTLACSTLLPRARAEDASYETLMATARALVLNADLRLQSTLALKSPPATLPTPEALIDLEDEVPSALKSEIRSLASGSARFARRALALRPGDPAAELFSTLGTGLRLWSMPTLQALASGAATTLPGQIKRLAAASPDFEGASPLRLKGRFQSRAPWPFKDLEAGRDTLAAAVEVAPIPLNLLFLGDAHWLCGESEAALERWLEATIAKADAETEAAAPFIREIARLRIESAGAAASR